MGAKGPSHTSLDSDAMLIFHVIQGVPLRLEIGPQDVQKKQILGVRRDTGEKAPITVADLATGVSKALETIQSDMYQRAYDTIQGRLRTVLKWEDVVPTLDDKCVVVMPWCEEEACEDDIKERSGKSYENSYSFICLI